VVDGRTVIASMNYHATGNSCDKSCCYVTDINAHTLTTTECVAHNAQQT
jgi:hypothetical protein